MIGKKRRVLVLGASGFVGSRLCEILGRHEDLEILPLVRNLGRAARLGRLGLPLIRGDALDEKLMDELVSRSDVVISLLIGGRSEIVRGARLSARLARKHGIARYVHVSSAAVYGIVAREDCVDESAPLRRTGHPYSDYKMEAELVVQKEAARGLSVVMLRPRVVWGPYSSWVTDFFAEIAGATEFKLVDEGAGACNTIFIDNLVDAIQWAVDAPVPAGSVYFVRDLEQLNWREYYEALAGLLSREIRFTSIDSLALDRIHAPGQGTRGPGLVRALAGLAGPLVGQVKRIEPVRRSVDNMSEIRKLRIKRILRMSWPERELQPYATGDGQRIPSRQRLARERGRGATQTDRILAAGWRPPVTFEAGLEKTAAWLRAAQVIRAG